MKRLATVAPLLFLFAGCVSRAELTAQREAIAQGTDTIRTTQKEWAQAIAGVPGHRLPDLTGFDEVTRKAWLNGVSLEPQAAFDKWLGEGRARDRAGWFGGGEK